MGMLDVTQRAQCLKTGYDSDSGWAVDSFDLCVVINVSTKQFINVYTIM